MKNLTYMLFVGEGFRFLGIVVFVIFVIFVLRSLLKHKKRSTETSSVFLENENTEIFEDQSPSPLEVAAMQSRPEEDDDYRDEHDTIEPNRLS